MFNLSKNHCLSDREYQTFLSELKSGDKVIVQQFQPQKKEFGVKTPELWIYSTAKIDGWDSNPILEGQIWFYSGFDHPLSKEGYITVSGRNVPYLHNVFPSRILPYSDKLSHVFNFSESKKNEYAFGRIPVYEPNYKGVRAIAIVDERLSGYIKYQKELKKKFPYQYFYSAISDNQKLLIIFCQDTCDVEEFLKESKYHKFLYEEGIFD